MIDIDKHMNRMHKNPYEQEYRPAKTCCICSEGIYDSDVHYDLDGRIYCERCVDYGRRFCNEK